MANEHVKEAINAAITTLEELNQKNEAGELGDKEAITIAEFLDAFKRINAVEDPPKPTTAPPAGKKYIKERKADGTAEWILVQI